MAESEKFNIPDKLDPEHAGKISELVRQLFELQGRDVKNLKPIETPDGTKQIGDMWYDAFDNKLRVNTPDGVKIVKYE